MLRTANCDIENIPKKFSNEMNSQSTLRRGAQSQYSKSLNKPIIFFMLLNKLLKEFKIVCVGAIIEQSLSNHKSV